MGATKKKCADFFENRAKRLIHLKKKNFRVKRTVLGFQNLRVKRTFNLNFKKKYA